jgi:hypothetical protein
MRLFARYPATDAQPQEVNVELKPLAGEVLEIDCKVCGAHVVTVTPDEGPVPGPVAGIHTPALAEPAPAESEAESAEPAAEPPVPPVPVADQVSVTTTTDEPAPPTPTT